MLSPVSFENRLKLISDKVVAVGVPRRRNDAGTAEVLVAKPVPAFKK